MYLFLLLHFLNKQNLIEIVDNRFFRIYYGTVGEMKKEDDKVLRGLHVEEVNSFLAMTNCNTFQTALQIRCS